MKQQGERGRRVVSRQGGGGARFLVLFKGRGRRVSPRFHLFVSVSQGKEWADWIQDFLA